MTEYLQNKQNAQRGVGGGRFSNFGACISQKLSKWDRHAPVVKD